MLVVFTGSGTIMLSGIVVSIVAVGSETVTGAGPAEATLLINRVAVTASIKPFQFECAIVFMCGISFYEMKVFRRDRRETIHQGGLKLSWACRLQITLRGIA